MSIQLALLIIWILFWLGILVRANSKKCKITKLGNKDADKPPFCDSISCHEIPMPKVKPPLVKTDKVELTRGQAVYDKDFGYIVVTLRNPIHFASQEIYIREDEIEKILLELKK